jgi:hypothetical protein
MRAYLVKADRSFTRRASEAGKDNFPEGEAFNNGPRGFTGRETGAGTINRMGMRFKERRGAGWALAAMAFMEDSAAFF